VIEYNHNEILRDPYADTGVAAWGGWKTGRVVRVGGAPHWDGGMRYSVEELRAIIAGAELHTVSYK
jgi:hypothetical protein